MSITFRDLIKAALKGDVNYLRQHLEDGFDADTCSTNRVTALMMAAKKGHLEPVKVLLEYGSNPNIVSQEGYTALNYATDRIVIETLLNAGGIYKSVIPTVWLKKSISLAELNTFYANANEDWVRNRFDSFKSLLLPNHELWTFESPHQALAWTAGYAIVYQGDPVRTLVTARG